MDWIKQARLAVGAFAVLSALALFSVSTAWADELYDDMGPTKCGAGTLQQCGTEPITKCEVDISINLNLFSRDFGFHFKTTNCEVIGQVPIYKDTPTSGTSSMCVGPDPSMGSLMGAGC
jgi:hypothetical protein